MGQTLRKLSSRPLETKAVFDRRFVVEICEAVHVHYRNLRIILSLKDWKEMAEGMADSLNRWRSRGCPGTQEGTHIELCRKEVATNPVVSDEIKVNLNRNLYPLHEGRVFSEGAEIKEPMYIHLKIRDLRIEMSLEEFAELAETVAEARIALKEGAHVGA